MNEGRGKFSPRFVALASALGAALVLGFVMWDALARSRHILDLSEHYGVTVDAPRADPKSPTGYEGGRRSLVLPEIGEDTAHWMMQTQAMIARGEGRVRSVDYDNAPRGREVHWAAPLHWCLAAVAWADRAVTGHSPGVAVERATLIFGPAMFALMLLTIGPLLARRFSLAAALLFALGAVAVFPFYTDFLPGRTDHHVLANLCSLLTVLLLAVAAEARDLGAARRWCAGSAIAGGVGMWISAATLIPVLIGIGLGALAASWLGRRAPEKIAWLRVPELWRWWGGAGAAVSLVAWLVEYFPSHLALRLEVNHPLHAAAWLGGGELLRLAIGAMARERSARTRRDVALGVGGALLLVLPVLVVMFAGEKTFAIADPFLLRLHTRYIAEFQGVVRLLAVKGFGETWIETCLPLLLLLPPIVALLRRATPDEARAEIALVLAPALVGAAMSVNELRWLGLAFALSVPALAVFFRRIAAPRWFLICGLALAPGAVSAVRRALATDEFTPEEVQHLVERDVAHWLRLRSGGERVVVAGAPSSTTALIAFGGVTGVGTLYWENAEGLRHAGEFFAAPSADAAHELARRFGLTHIVLFSWDAFELPLAKEFRGLAPEAPLPADIFVANLLRAAVPPAWLRAVPFKLPDNAALAGQQVRIWEIVREQTAAEAAAHAANYYLELGQPQVAAQLEPELTRSDDRLAAAVMRAALASRRRDAAAFSAALSRVQSQLAQADELGLDDRVHLVVVLVVGQQLELARAQLRAGVTAMNERELRRLTPGTLSDLLALSEALAVEWPDAKLRRLAEQLVPPSRRK
ncbi:MAG TPA: hypothetical protein VHD62_17120 [Opitutaceae bacterium]|nr:hypothetical protein [Opitutaceae bacterium]